VGLWGMGEKRELNHDLKSSVFLKPSAEE